MNYLFKDDESYTASQISEKLVFSPKNNHKSCKNWIDDFRIPKLVVGHVWACSGSALNNAIRHGKPDKDDPNPDHPQFED